MQAAYLELYVAGSSQILVDQLRFMIQNARCLSSLRKATAKC